MQSEKKSKFKEFLCENKDECILFVSMYLGITLGFSVVMSLMRLNSGQDFSLYLLSTSLVSGFILVTALFMSAAFVVLLIFLIFMALRKTLFTCLRLSYLLISPIMFCVLLLAFDSTSTLNKVSYLILSYTVPPILMTLLGLAYHKIKGGKW